MEKLQEILEKIYDKSIYLLIAIIFMYIGFKLTNLYIKHLKKDKLLIKSLIIGLSILEYISSDIILPVAFISCSVV